MFVSEIYDEAAEILGTSDQKRIFKKLTQAIAALMESGNWFHGNQEVDVCTGWDGYTLTLPRGIEVPLAVNIDGSPTYFRDRAFQYHVNKGGAFSAVPWAWDDRGVVATIMDIRQPSEVVAVAENPNDAGQVIRLVGTDNNGRAITSQLDDGTLVDGLLIPIHAISDFEYGVITPDGNRINTRQVAISPFTNFISSTAHYLSTGQPVIVSPLSDILPSPLINGNQYYVGVVTPEIVELYSDPLYAQSGELPIQLQSIAGAGQISLIDAIPSQVVTSVNLQSPTASPIVVQPANEVVFGEIASQPLPAPLIPGATYFANQIDPSDLQVFETISDATNNINPVYLTGSTSQFNVDVRTPASPQTQFQMPASFLYQTGDVVQVYNNAGQLPAPLVAAQNYYVHVVAGGSALITLHTNAVDAQTGANPITVTSSGTGQSSVVKTIPATSNVGLTNQITAPGINISAPAGSGASITAVITGSVTAVNMTYNGTGYDSVPQVTFSDPVYTPPPNSGQSVRTATAYAIMAGSGTAQTVASIVITDGGAGYTSIPTITITGGGPTTTATATATITTSFVGNYTINNPGSGYTYSPIITVSGGGGSGATAVAQVLGGQVTQVNPVALGTGYASAPTVTATPSTGVNLQFSSTGALPSPMQPGVAYLAGTPLNTSTGTFTILNADGSPLNITAPSSGSFSVDVSYPLGTSPSNIWGGNFSGLARGDTIYFGTDYLLPTTSPSIDSGVTPFYIKPISPSTAEFYQDAGLTVLVTTIAIGTGQSYIAARIQAQALPYQNQIAPSSVQYLQNGQPVQFSISSGGTLPGGIAANTPYTLALNGGVITLSGVTLTAIPTGLLSMNIVNAFTAQASTTITAQDSALSTGTAIIPRPSTGDILDPSLISGDTYYVRRATANAFSLYATFDEAMAGGSTGLLSYVTTGNTTASTFFVDAVTPPTLVKSVLHVQKPVTSGYVSLYAFDYGRSNDMCLIGQYHPSETNPQYRRVRLGRPAAWARIMYRMKAPEVTSIYDYLPLEQSRAMICAIHAVDLEDKDFFDQAAKYWARADGYLKNLETSSTGHAMSALQVDQFWAPGEGCVMM